MTNLNPNAHKTGHVLDVHGLRLEIGWDHDGVYFEVGGVRPILGPDVRDDFARHYFAADEAAKTYEAEAAAEAATDLGDDALRCPECGSPGPRLHPAISDGGEVTRICPDPFHGPVGALEAWMDAATAAGKD